MQIRPFLYTRLAFAFGVLGALLLTSLSPAVEEGEVEQAPIRVSAAGTVSEAAQVKSDASAVVNFEELARQEAAAPPPSGPVKTWMPPEHEPPPEPFFPAAPTGNAASPAQILSPSPPPTSSFMGLDDIPMADSSFVIIPPDIAGAVGPDKVMESFNNNYRIRNKTTGATLQTLGTATFWAPVVVPSERLNLTDPRTLYDPYNNRWITCMQTFTTGAGKLLVGVSQTSDPSGSWYLYSFAPPGATLDFPDVGFNKNWISIAVNSYTTGGAFLQGINLVVDYPSARTGTGTGTLFTHGSGSHFCSAPCATYSSTEGTLYVVTHLSSAGATYVLDTITGTPSAPVYTTGVTMTRTGGGWVQPGGNQLPQSAPNAGASACGATPCKIESQDSQVRSAPVFRGGFIYYTQTVGLPSGGLTHTGVQWTKIAAPGGTFSDGGRIEDPTATATNGGKWYAYPHIAVNSLGDFIVGYTQFSSAQHPGTGYSIHLASDGAGTIRDPLIYHAGEDYYHKTFSTATGRNRWGDFSTAQVDPSDDQTLWTLQEYGKTRVGTNDGNTGSNSSRWSSWWAGVSTVTNYTITASAGAGGAISPSGAVVVPSGGNQSFTITSNPCFHISDVLVDGVSQGPIASYMFMNVMANHTISASFAINTYTITASAGTGGSISPSGAVGVNCGSDQGFTIIPDPCNSIADVLVDGSSIGPVSSYNFTNVQANHTIAASFAINTFTLATSVVGAGSLLVVPLQPSYSCGDSVTITATADPGWAFDHWTGDASGTANPLILVMTANMSITGVFVDIALPSVTVTSPNGGEVWMTGDTQPITWTATDNVGVTTIDLEYSTDGGATYPNPIAAGIANTGSYPWLVPATATLTARVRATAHDAAANSGTDTSDVNFEIQDPSSSVASALLGPDESMILYPNPALVGTVHVLYRMRQPGAAEVNIFDVAGHLVRRLPLGSVPAGVHDLRWDGRDGKGNHVGAGIYLVRVTAGKQSIRRLVLVR